MSIYDIAQHSGVLIVTVSYVINGSPNVSAVTWGKMIAMIEQEDYIPSAFTRGLNLNSMKIIETLCTDIADTFCAKVVSLVEGLLYRNEFDALLYRTGNDLEDKKKYLEPLLAKRVDAVILIGSAFKESVSNSHIGDAAKQVPAITINGLVELPGTCCVTRDEQSAVTQSITLLNRQKYRDILYLYNTLTYNGCFKLSSYRTRMKQCRLPVGENLIVQVPKLVGEVRRRMLSLLESGVSFNAVMTSEDPLAISAMKALQEFGRSAPVIGFNNSALSECCFPPLTSVDNMLDTLCPVIISILTEILEGKSVPQKMVISTTLVQRDVLHTDLQQEYGKPAVHSCFQQERSSRCDFVFYGRSVLNVMKRRTGGSNHERVFGRRFPVDQ